MSTAENTNDDSIQKPDSENGRIIELEGKLKQAEEKFKNLQLLLHSEINNRLAEGIVLIAADTGKIIFTNPAFDKMFGYIQGELIGRPVHELNAVNDKDPEETAKEIITCLNDAGTWKGEIINIRKDKTKFWCHASVSEFDHPTYGKVWLSLHQDITDRKVAEKALHENEQRLRTLVNNVPGVSYRCACDEHWTMEFISSEIETLSGYPRSDFIANKERSYASIIHPDDIQAVDAGVVQGVNEHRPFTLEYRIVRANGETRWVFEKGQGVFDDNGNLQWLDGVILDITESKQAEFALLESERKYRLLFENMTTGFALHEIICDEDGKAIDYRYLELNPAFEKLTGVPTTALLGKTVKEVLPETEDYWIETSGKVALTGESIAYENYARELGKYYDTWLFRADKNKFAVIFSDVTERKKSEELIKEGNKQFQVLFEQSSFGVAKIDSNSGKFVKINQHYCDLVGYSHEEMVELDFQTITHPDDLKGDLDNMEKLRAGDIAQIKREKRYFHKDGSIVWVNLSVLPLWEKGESADFHLAIVEDITERVRIEKELAEKQRSIVSLMGILPGMVYRCRNDQDWSVDFASQGCQELTGYPASDLVARKVSFGQDIIHPEDAAQVWDGVQAGLEAKTNYQLTYRIIRADQEVRWVWEQGKGIFNDNDELVALEGFITDITQRKIAEEELEKHRIHLEELVSRRTLELQREVQQHALAEAKIKTQQEEQLQIINNIADAIIVIEDNGIVRTFSKTAELMYGYTESEVVGRNISMLMPSNFARYHDNYISRYLSTGRSTIIGSGKELVGRKKNGETFPVRISLAELPRDINGKRRFVGSCHDLTIEKQNEEQLRRSQKMDALGKLTGGIAHDFNNILAVILGFVQLLNKLPYSDSRQKEYIGEISNAGERAKKLTTRLMAFSKEKASVSQVININNVIMEMRNMLETTLTVRINLEFNLPDDLWPVSMDKSGLEDALLNMCINSAHAMPSGGVITITTRNISNINGLEGVPKDQPGNYVCLSITDTGTGMSKETKQKLFDPFFTTKGDEGTGLGMSQVYGFVKRSGGFINVVSELNQGTRLDLYFPDCRRQDVDADSRMSVGNEDRINNESILVVDDEAPLTKISAAILEESGYRVFTAVNGDQALSILGKESIDLVISDVIMPGMDGFELAQKIRKNYPLVKLQLVSGYIRDDYNDSVEQDLIDNLLRKPVDEKVLTERVRIIFEEK